MPARAEEIAHAEEEGIKFELLTNPVRIHGDEKGFVCGVTCVRMRLGEPGKDGRRRPIVVEGSEFDIPCDELVVALGTTPNPLIRAAIRIFRPPRRAPLSRTRTAGRPYPAVRGRRRHDGSGDGHTCDGARGKRAAKRYSKTARRAPESGLKRRPTCFSIMSRYS